MTNINLRASLGYIFAFTVACLLLAVFIVVAIAAEKKDYKDSEQLVVEPGWILCMGPQARYYRGCRMFLVDGPMPQIEAPK